MRLDFNVLWVDDQPHRVASQITAIERRMRAEGFQFNAKQCQSIAQVKSALSDHVFTDQVDLILVDWDLGNGVEGQDAIAEIRTSVRFKDVVFYSAAPADLKRLAFEKGLEGVYCASREQLVLEVMGVFDSLVKKVLDLDHTRGIVMGATSDIDHLVNQCLVAVHENLDAPGKQGLLKATLGHVERRVKDVTKTAKKLEKATTLSAFFKAHMILTSNDRLLVLRELLETTGAQLEYIQLVDTYQKDVIRKRNQLGHMVLAPQGEARGVTNGEGELVTVEGTRRLRCQILESRTAFRSLLEALQSRDVLVAEAAVPGDAE